MDKGHTPLGFGNSSDWENLSNEELVQLQKTCISEADNSASNRRYLVKDTVVGKKEKNSLPDINHLARINGGGINTSYIKVGKR